MSLVDALLEVGSGNIAGALSLVTKAHEAQTGSLLAPALAGYLGTAQHDGVYDEPTAFAEFIDNGSNPLLYSRTIELLGAQHRDLKPARVLDIGCGDGRVTRAVLQPEVDAVDLVEPSSEMLATAVAASQSLGRWVGGHQVGISDYLAVTPEGSWDLAQSTFALHGVAPPERKNVLAQLVGRVRQLVVVEFDVPDFDDRSIDHARYAVERYEVGVGEYANHPRVVSGFLMPVLVGQFAPVRPRLTFEQSAQRWTGDLLDAGFEDVAETAVADYWWAPAKMLVAS